MDTATLIEDSAKEFTDNWCHLMDMVVNFSGANTGLVHRRSRLENKYEREFGLEIGDCSDLLTLRESSL